MIAGKAAWQGWTLSRSLLASLMPFANRKLIELLEILHIYLNWIIIHHLCYWYFTLCFIRLYYICFIIIGSNKELLGGPESWTWWSKDGPSFQTLNSFMWSHFKKNSFQRNQILWNVDNFTPMGYVTWTYWKLLFESQMTWDSGVPT